MAYVGVRNYFSQGNVIATEDVTIGTAPDSNPTATTGKALVVAIGSWLSTVTAAVVGNVAHDDVDSGAPVKIGGYGKDTAPSAASAAADRVNAWYTLVGAAASTPVSAAGTVLSDTNGVYIRTFTGIPTANFTRPANTTAYTSGDLVANNVTAGSVVAMTLAASRGTSTGGLIRKCRVKKSGTSVTTASFRLHLYNTAPTVTNGDNGVWLSNNSANYIGSLDVTVDKAFSDGAVGDGTPTSGSELQFTTTNVYGLLEARSAYTPASAEIFTIELEVVQN